MISVKCEEEYVLDSFYCSKKSNFGIMQMRKSWNMNSEAHLWHFKTEKQRVSHVSWWIRGGIGSYYWMVIQKMNYFWDISKE